MKLHFSLKPLAVAFAMGFGMLAPAFADDDEDTPLAKEMSVLSKSLKKLRKAETTEEKIKLVHAAQASTIKSLEYIPEMFAQIKDAKEKAKATADYKRLMGLTYVDLCALEIAYLEGDEDKADELKSKLKGLKKEGHRKYTE